LVQVAHLEVAQLAVQKVKAVQVVLQLFQVLLPQAVVVEAKVILVPIFLEVLVVQVEVAVEVLVLPVEEVATALLFLLLKEVLVVQILLEVLQVPQAVAVVEQLVQVPVQDLLVVVAALVALVLQQI
jgi:hypothetical protein